MSDATAPGREALLARWTRFVVRRRRVVLVAWLVVLVVSGGAANRLQPLLSTSIAIPGSESERARALLASAFDERPDGTFTVVLRTTDTDDAGLRRRLGAGLEAAASALPGGRAGEVRDGDGVLYGDVATSLELQDAKRRTDEVRAAVRQVVGPGALVTGQPALQHDIDPIVLRDLRRGEAIAIPLALLVLLATLGVSLAVAVPFLVAACTIAVTLALLVPVAASVSLTTYVTSLVGLIGLGLAVDYSLLVVLRQREELRREGPVEDAVVRTMATAGRTALVSAGAVAIGLALLLLVPVPLVRTMGLGAILLPAVSAVALLTLQPALLAVLGRRGLRGAPWLRQAPDGAGLWARAARLAIRRPAVVALLCGALLATLALPALSTSLTPGSLAALPRDAEAVDAYHALEEGIGPGVVTPTWVVVDTRAPGGARRADVERAVDRLGDRLFEDFTLIGLASGTKPPYVDRARRLTRLAAAGRREYGAPATRQFVERLRERYVPDAGFPADVEVVTGGAPAQGVDFLDHVYASLPLLLAAAAVLAGLVLLAAFRSIAVPVKAIFLDVLTVGATLGVLVLLFQEGHGERLGLARGEIEGWVPIFLLAVLFGLTIDYEVFVVSRIREAWLSGTTNDEAIVTGLGRTGRVVTASALVMTASFLGFVLGSIPSLQQLGVGLIVGVLLDATLVRGLMLPATMALLGRWNWWLPGRAGSG